MMGRDGVMWDILCILSLGLLHVSYGEEGKYYIISVHCSSMP